MKCNFRHLCSDYFLKLICFFLISVSIVLAGCIPKNARVPEAKDGFLELTGFDLPENGPLELTAGWLIFPQKLIFPDQFADDKAPDGKTISQLSAWDKFEKTDPAHPEYRAATARMVISGVPKECPLGLRVGVVDEACRIWVNGSLVYENGRIGTDKASGFPGSPELVFLPLSGNDGQADYEIVIHLARFNTISYNYGFTLFVGERDHLDDEIAREKSALLFSVTLLLVMGTYHLIFYFFRRRESALLYFSLFCFCWMIEKGSNGLYYWLVRFFMSNVDIPIMERLNIISHGFTLPFSFLFIRELFPDETPDFLPKIYLILISILSVWLLFDISACTIIFTCTQYVVLSTIIPMMAVFIAAVRAGRKNARVMLAGIAIAVVFGVFHTLSDLRIISFTGHITIDIGLLIIIVTQAVCLARQFAWSFNETEDLSLKLQQANTDLKKLDRLKDEFLANTTHELLTPLSGVIGLAESMMAGASGKLPESAVKNLRMMAASGKRLDGLVRNILDFSRLKTKDIHLAPIPLDIRTAVETVLTLIQPLAGGLRLKSQLPKELPPILADENRLHQILFNLIGNAIKYTETGEILVIAVPEGQHIRISVSDTGIGIPEEKRNLIFKRFERIHTLPSTDIQGTGLGLSIAKDLVELHGGEIGFHAREEGGTTFWFTLPVAWNHAGEINTISSTDEVSREEFNDPFPVSFPETMEKMPEASGGKSLILVVDDDHVNIQVAMNHLKTDGYQVITARGGKEALAMLPADRKPDLILLDIMMPGMDGYETCRIIRETRSMSDLPVILLTAKIQVQDMVSGFDAGANDYLTKPFSREELLARVRTQIKIRQAYRVLRENTLLKKEIERRKITELDLKMMQQRLARILDFLDDAIIAVNESIEICFSNASFRRLTGYQDRDLLGLPANFIFPQAEMAVSADMETLSIQPEKQAQIRQNDGVLLSCTIETAGLDIEGETLKVIVIRKMGVNTKEAGAEENRTDPISFIEKIGLNEKQIERLENSLASNISLSVEEKKNTHTIEGTGTTNENEPEDSILQQSRRLGATIMNQALDLWSIETGTTKIDLADQSGIWKVYVNSNGFARAQTLDKYLSEKIFPQNPRWPKIYQTVEYVLAGCTRETPQRKDLEESYLVLKKMV